MSKVAERKSPLLPDDPPSKMRDREALDDEKWSGAPRRQAGKRRTVWLQANGSAVGEDWESVSRVDPAAIWRYYRVMSSA